MCGTISYGLRFSKEHKEIMFEAWSNANWAREEIFRRFRTRHLIRLKHAPVLWIWKLQTSFAHSTSEAGFPALASRIRVVIYIWDLLQEVGCKQKEATVIFQDIHRSIKCTKNVKGIQKVKHISIKYHAVCECVNSFSNKVMCKPSTENRADWLTKTTESEMHNTHCKWLGVVKQNW